MKYTDAFLRGPEEGQDAAFRDFGQGEVFVSAAAGNDKIYDDLCTVETARERWSELTARGWKRTNQPRRGLNEIRFALL